MKILPILADRDGTIPVMTMKREELYIDEIAWLHRLHQHDRKAFDALFHRFQPGLVFFARRLLGEESLMEAEEVVQDSLLKFHDRIGSFEGWPQIKAFLYITTKNTCLQRLDKVKTQKKRQRHFLYHFTESEDAVLSEIIYAEVLNEVNQAISELPPRCQEITKLFFEEGLNAREIADILDLTVSTVNNQKSRAIKLLKNKLSSPGMTFLMFYL